MPTVALPFSDYHSLGNLTLAREASDPTAKMQGEPFISD